MASVCVKETNGKGERVVGRGVDGWREKLQVVVCV